MTVAPEMTVWTYWGSVLRRSFFEALTAIGQSPEQLGYYLLTLAVTGALLWSRKGPSAVGAHLKRAAILAAVAVVAWLPFFIYRSGMTVYQDYMTQLRRANDAETQLNAVRSSASQPPPQRPLSWRERAPKDPFSFTLFEVVPDARTTHIEAVNDHGDVIGTYAIGSEAKRFLRLADGTLTYIEHPDDARMYVSLSGLNNRRDIVGIHGDTRTGRHGQFNHGFVRREDGRFLSFTCLGSSYTRPAAINDHGEIVGNVLDTTGLERGFLRKGDGTCVALDYPGALSTLPTAINNRGEVVGLWGHPKGGGGFLRRLDGTFIQIQADPPENFQPKAINDDGVVVGQTGRGGFLRRRDGTLLPLDHPLCASPCTRPTGINGRGQVVGYFQPSNLVFSFVAKLKPEK